MPADRRPLQVRRLGEVPYAEGLELQATLVADRRAGRIPDTLLLLEHPHVLTMGSSTDPAHVLLDTDERARRGIELFETGRGGDVTYHGPGQLVAYPILDLKPDRKDLHRYLRDLETILIAALGDYGLSAGTKTGMTGVWVDASKIAAIGVRVSSGWITSHGLALNVCTDLSYFDAIVPCGIREWGVTSLERVLTRPVTVGEVEGVLARHFADAFDYDILVA